MSAFDARKYSTTRNLQSKTTYGITSPNDSSFIDVTPGGNVEFSSLVSSENQNRSTSRYESRTKSRKGSIILEELKRFEEMSGNESQLGQD